MLVRKCTEFRGEREEGREKVVQKMRNMKSYLTDTAHTKVL